MVRALYPKKSKPVCCAQKVGYKITKEEKLNPESGELGRKSF